MGIVKNSTGKADEWEYPLYDQYELCPTRQYVGMSQVYRCQCQEPEQCPGVLKVAELYGGQNTRILYKVFRGELKTEDAGTDREYRLFAGNGWVESAEKAWEIWNGGSQSNE